MGKQEGKEQLVAVETRIEKMMTILFRSRNKDASEKNLPDGFYGIAFARTHRELFWQIDEFLDPFSCEIAILEKGALLINLQFDKENCPTIKPCKTASDDEDFEISESMWGLPELDWVTPTWDIFAPDSQKTLLLVEKRSES